MFTIQESTSTPVMMVSSPPESNIVMNTGNDEMIKITKDGFYVRGVKVPADDKEAEEVYNAFKRWLAWSTLTS